MKSTLSTESSDAFRQAHLRFRRRALAVYLLVIGGMFVALLRYTKGRIWADTLSLVLFCSFWIFTLGFVVVCAVVLKRQQAKFRDEKAPKR